MTYKDYIYLLNKKDFKDNQGRVNPSIRWKWGILFNKLRKDRNLTLLEAFKAVFPDSKPNRRSHR